MENGIKIIKKELNEEKKYDILNKILDEEFDNKKLINTLRDVFAKKGLTVNIITTLFAREQDWDDIEHIGQMAFIDGCYKALEWEYLKLDKWFGEMDIANYLSYVKVDEKLTKIELKSFLKMDDYTYSGLVEIGLLGRWLESILIKYNKDSQRASKYTTLGTSNKIIRTISFNQKAIEEIIKSVNEGTYEFDMVCLNALLINRKVKPLINFEEYNITDNKGNIIEGRNVYDITITPNYDIKSNNYTVVDLVDGFHRTMAFKEADSVYFNRTGNHLTALTPVRFSIGDIERGKRIVAQTFKRSDTNPNWKKAIEVNDYTVFLNNMIKKSKVLNNKVASYYDEYLYQKNSLTHKLTMLYSLKKIKTIDFKSKMQSSFDQQLMADIIDKIFEYLTTTYYDGKMRNLIKESYLADVNIFCGYIIMASILMQQDEENIDIYIKKVCDELYLVHEEDKDKIINLKLKERNPHFNEIYCFFKDLTEEVINNE